MARIVSGLSLVWINLLLLNSNAQLCVEVWNGNIASANRNGMNELISL